MGFLNKLFGNKDADNSANKKPDNTNLNYLLTIWGEHPSNENYAAVFNEILAGNGYFLLPSIHDNNTDTGWQTLNAGSTLKLTSVYNVDGLQVLGVFSDEKSLLAWANKEVQYTSIKTPDVIEFCQQHGIDRIVVNSDQKTMFVLERNRSNITTNVVEKDTEVQIGSPAKPLSQNIIAKLTENFKKVNTIEEAYQYAQVLNGETSIVLGIKMSVVSDDSRAALHNALNTSLQNEKLELPLDIMILNDEWLQSVRDIANSLIYKKQAD